MSGVWGIITGIKEDPDRYLNSVHETPDFTGQKGISEAF
jgi:hypothetical protein